VYRFTMFIYFNLEFSGEKIKVKVEVRGLILGRSSFASINIIKIPSISRIQILRHISFFKLTSEYLEYIL
jgi:hypothetical protein